MSIEHRTWVAPDGTRIAYCVEGLGPALVLTNGLTTSTTFWKHVRPIWLRRHTVVTWDLPGHGRSGPAQSPQTASMQTQPELLVRVMQAAGVARAAQIGWSTGCQIVLETYRQFPERCDSLVMLFGPAGRVLQTTRLPLSGSLIYQLVNATPEPAFSMACRLLARAMRAPGSHALGRWLGLIGDHAAASDIEQVLAHIGSVHPPTLQRLLLTAEQHSAQAVLRDLQVPLLIVAGDRDPFAPSELVGVPMHACVQGSELLRLPMATHTALLEEPQLIANAVENFLTHRGHA